MKTTITINNRAQFISYRSQLMTETIGKHLFLTFAMIGCVAFTQLPMQGTFALENSAVNSITFSDEVNEIEQELMEEMIPEFKQ